MAQNAQQKAADSILYGMDAGEMREYLTRRLATGDGGSIGAMPYYLWRTGCVRLAEMTGLSRSEIEANLREDARQQMGLS